MFAKAFMVFIEWEGHFYQVRDGVALLAILLVGAAGFAVGWYTAPSKRD